MPDLLAEVTERRSKSQTCLGFAALTGTDSEILKMGEIKKRQKGCDLLFANPIDRPNQGFEENCNGGWLIGPHERTIEFEVTSKFELAHRLLDEMLAFQSNVSTNN